MMKLDYALGCPVWACDHWRGGLYRSHAPRSHWLEEYSSVFNCVEGNSTFYGLPSDEVVTRWRCESPAGFHFALKFPQTVTHDAQLRGFPADARRFWLSWRRTIRRGRR